MMLKTLVAGLARQQLDVDHRDVPAPHHDGAARVGGFSAFAVPNVIGCTAFGCAPQTWSRHRPARKLKAKPRFSSATIALHVVRGVLEESAGRRRLVRAQSEALVAARLLSAAFLLSLLPKSVFPWLGPWCGWDPCLFGLRADTLITSAAPCDLNALWSLPLFTAGLLIARISTSPSMKCDARPNAPWHGWPSR